MLGSAIDSDRAELVAVYGRRRVGKTFLVDELSKRHADLYFSVIGAHGRPMEEQLYHFRQELERVFYASRALPPLTSWEDAFRALSAALETAFRAASRRRIVVFLDELPWLQTRRSGLIERLEYHWNKTFSRMPRLTIVLCGSAASWMLDNVVHARGGLYNRITRRIRLDPFTLGESEAFLRAKGFRAHHQQVLELYFALGGIPHYLDQVERGFSAAQNVGRICFDRNGVLADELIHLFRALFSSSERHEAIVHALAAKRGGLDREEIIRATKLSSGGGLFRALRELEEAGFIVSLTPYGSKRKHTLYRLQDEYSLFYLRWIAPSPKRLSGTEGAAYWLKKQLTPAYRSWAGLAFEGTCLKHADLISRALGLDSVATETATWRFAAPVGTARTEGAQVDLLLDRADGVINLCEMKYAAGEYVVSKSYARELKTKLEVFETATKTKKDVRLTVVTTHGLRRNVWSEGLVDSVVTLKSLFQ